MTDPIRVNVSDEGWISKAMDVINGPKTVPLEIVVNGKTAWDIVLRIVKACEQAHIRDLVKALPGLLGGANPATIALQVVPTMTTLAAIAGAAGGALSSVVVVVSWGLARDRTLSLGVRFVHLLRPLDNELVITLA